MRSDVKSHPLLVQNPLSRSYDNLEFTLATGISDYNVGANVAGAFSGCKVYTTINVRSDKDITVKLNAATNHGITVQANKPFELDNQVEIINLYISNSSGDTANIKVFGTRKDGGI